MYSKDFRLLALKLYRQHNSFTTVANILHCGRTTVYRWVRHGIGVASRHRHHKTWLHRAGALVGGMLETSPTTTLKEVCRRLFVEHAMRVSARTVCSIVKRVGYSYKRVKCKVDTGSIGLCKENRFCELFIQHDTDTPPEHETLSIDECYFSERVVPRYGYSKQGLPCAIRSQSGHWKQRTLLLAISNRGRRFYDTYIGACNRERFEAFITSLPCAPGTVLILDNVSFHHPNVRNTPFHVYNRKGYHTLFTPPYRPEYNPVEHIFSKVKRQYRSTFDWVGHTVEDRVVMAMESVDQDDILNVFDGLRRRVMERTAQAPTSAG